MKRMILFPFCIAAMFVAGCLDVPEPPPPVVIAPNSAPMPVAPAANPAPVASNDLALLQGTWTGRDVTPGHDGAASITFLGHNLEFHGANDNDWCTGTFTLNETTNPKQLTGVIANAPAPDAIGKKSSAIYKIENGTLMISGFAPGMEGVPAAFDAPEARQLQLKRQP